MHEKAVTAGFRCAARDYLMLVEKKYAQASALKLVGDRYQLTSVQRSMLYRGIVGSREAASRIEKKTHVVSGVGIRIDALNVLYTVANYLYGKVLFISTDSWLRDAGEVHGGGMPSPRRGTKLETAIELTIAWLASQRPAEATFYIDKPVSMSGELAARIRGHVDTAGLTGDAVTVPSADFELKRAPDGVVATSDSTIIDAARRPVCDLAHEVLEARFQPELVDLRALIEEESQ